MEAVGLSSLVNEILPPRQKTLEFLCNDLK